MYFELNKIIATDWSERIKKNEYKECDSTKNLTQKSRNRIAICPELATFQHSGAIYLTSESY